MKIGISILTRQGHSLWENGLGQNVFHLADCLSALPFVEGVWMIDTGEQGGLPADAPDTMRRYPIVTLADAIDIVDVAIELQGGLDVEWLDRLRARGGRSVFHICGQPYAALIEPSVFGGAGYFARPDRCDEVWLLPKDAAFAPMLHTLHRCPVLVVPYLWSPQFLDWFVARDAEENGNAPPFGYVPGALTKAQTASASIFEPNISVVKTGMVPLLACEEAERANPGLFSRVTLYNGVDIKDHTTFCFLREQLTLARSGTLVFAGREFFSRAMRGTAGIVVSHHLDNAQNYLYLDALHGGYPLVHNSEPFRDAGYYYTGSDIGEAARQIARAVKGHDQNLVGYRATARRTIASLSPANDYNRRDYARRLIALVQGGGQ